MTISRDDLLFVIHNLARLLGTEVDRRARQRGMTRTQWAMLIWLERRPGMYLPAVDAECALLPAQNRRLSDLW